MLTAGVPSVLMLVLRRLRFVFIAIWFFDFMEEEAGREGGEEREEVKPEGVFSGGDVDFRSH